MPDAAMAGALLGAGRAGMVIKWTGAEICFWAES